MTDAANRLVFDRVARRIGLRVGKVELGQHIHETYEILMAQALGVDVAQIRVLPVSTDDSPDDGLTVGSLSVQVTGQALADMALTLSRELKDCAARRLNEGTEDVALDPVNLHFTGRAAVCDLFDIVADHDAGLLGPVPDIAPGAAQVADAITGQRLFLPDMALPGMIHACALRGRDLSEVKALLTADLRLITDGGFAAVIAEDEAALLALWGRLPPPATPADRRCDGPVAGWIKAQRRLTTQLGPDPSRDAGLHLSASRPFLLHGSIAPSCAIALWQDNRLTVWTHSQGIFPLRVQIARVLDLDPAQVTLNHVPSAGSYGHSGADDAALDAALVAIAMPERPVRVAWPREDEFRHAPVGAPMLVEASLTLDQDKQITGWHQQIWSGPHGQRPGGGGHVNLLAALERAPDLRPKNIAELPVQVGSAAGRNAVPIYAIPAVAVTTHVVQDLPVRSSSLRGLGAQINTVAIEAAMDRLAAETGESPFAVRDRHLDDPRARSVLYSLEEMCSAALQVADDTPDEAVGIGLGRYKNKAAYAAVAARVRLEDAPRLIDLWTVVDAGQVISRDGALNQIEGGLIQAASWTLHEGALLRDGQIDGRGWPDYPTLGWADVPGLHVQLVDHGDRQPPLGVGECMVGPTSAAIVNAISRVLGLTMAHLPLNRARLIEVLSE